MEPGLEPTFSNLRAHILLIITPIKLSEGEDCLAVSQSSLPREKHYVLWSHTGPLRGLLIGDDQYQVKKNT